MDWNFFGIEEEFCNEENIIYKAMIECFKKRNYKIKGLRISILKNEIPISRGLGSSSSCIVGGIIGANEIMGQKLSKEELLELAVSMEGHPDNVVPALLGGIVIAIVIKGKVIYDKVKVKDDLDFIPIIPDFKLSTEKARAVLPNKISFEDGVYNVGRVALMVTALNNGNYDLLKFACDDRFHEIYRGNLIKGFDIIKKESYNNGALASFLSGAGPTIMTIINRKNSFSNKMREVLDREGVNYSILNLSIDNEGAVVIEGGNK